MKQIEKTKSDFQPKVVCKDWPVSWPGALSGFDFTLFSPLRLGTPKVLTGTATLAHPSMLPAPLSLPQDSRHKPGYKR